MKRDFDEKLTLSWGVVSGILIMASCFFILTEIFPEETDIYQDAYQAGYNQCMNENFNLTNGNLKVLEDNSKNSGSLYIGTFNLSKERGSWIFESLDGSRIEIENTCEGIQTFKINSTFIGCEK